MNKSLRFIFITIIININIIYIISDSNNSIISLKFKTFYPYSNNSNNKLLPFNTEDYFEKIHLSKIYLEVGTGDQDNFTTHTNQTLNILVKLEEIILFTTSNYFEKFTSENNALLCHYNCSLSTSFSQSKDFYKFRGFDSLSSYGHENFKIYTDIFLSNYIIKSFNFLNTINSNESNICGSIGLGYMHKESIDYNFLGQLHHKFNLPDYSFFFNYSSKTSDEGIFIFGNMPHVYLPDKYNSDDLIFIYSVNMNQPLINIMGIKIEREGYKIEQNDVIKKIRINPDIEGIEFPEFYFNDYEEIFFNNFYNKKICHKDVYNRIYRVIYCDVGEEKFQEKNIKNFPNLTFYIDKKTNFSINFNGDDLFYFKDNKYFFKIIGNTLGNYFDLGRILFKKYLTILNQDKKQIYFYSKNNIDQDEKNGENNIQKSSNTSTIVVISCIICAIIFFSLGIYFGQKIFKKRGKVAYELNDGYDYSPAQDSNEPLAINQ